MAKVEKKTKKSGAPKKPPIGRRVATYLKDVRSEMKRVVWPGREEILSSSMIVITTLAFFLIFVLVADRISLFLIDALASLGR